MPAPTPTPTPLSIPHLLSRITTPYNPKLVAILNNETDLKIAKIKGPFIWHAHPDSDELFYVLNGTLILDLEIQDHDSESQNRGEDEGKGKGKIERLVMEKGDIYVVEKTVRHRPDGNAEVLIVERCGVVNTGNLGEQESAGRRIEVEDVRGLK